MLIMKLLDDLYWYPWTSLSENNSNTIFIGGEVPTLIDPGHAHLFQHLSREAAADGVSLAEVDLLIATHGHPDHFEASSRFHDQRTYIAMHEEEEAFIQHIGPAFYQAMGMIMPKFRVDFHLQEGDLILGSKRLQVIHTPGHSPGAISIYWPEARVLITGDVAFKEGVGRTDFPGCSGAALKESILRLMGLDVEYLLPGHGDLVKGRNEVKHNFALIQSIYFPLM
jgi:glyoxylase-like metal-dependent hydrolase (beta-lactamase superfamily II)